MPTSATIIIGANYGDEGKGLMTDYFCRRYFPSNNILNVRFNGGSQAGHTVITPESQRHVFSHFGSGTFAGARTFLAEDFIVNPMNFIKEHKELQKFGINPLVHIDHRCRVTTPFDMLLNLLKAGNTGINNTCGMGIYETISRCEDPEFSLTIGDIFDMGTSVMIRFLKDICIEYVPKWLAERTAAKTVPADVFKLFLKQGTIIENYVKDVQYLLGNCEISQSARELYNHYSDYLVFEGAQGLGLDKDSDPNTYFLTPSNTGLKGVRGVLSELNIPGNSSINVVYVSRNYVTRHGSGELPYSIANKPYKGVIDLTNVPNKFQGSIRYACLDLDALSDRIKRDLDSTNILDGYKVSICGAITCLDQVSRNGVIHFIDNSDPISLPVPEFIDYYEKKMSAIDMERVYLSYGPTYETIEVETIR